MEETPWWKLLAGWLTFFVLVYLYPRQVLALFVLAFFGVIIWDQIVRSSMTRKATVTGWIVGGLGLETAWKKYQTILVSNGGGKMQAEPDPKGDWARHSLRINEVIDNQVRTVFR